MLGTSVALDTQGNLYIDGLQWLQEIVNVGQTGIGGHLYSKYFPGNSIGAALLYRLGARSADQPYIWGNSEFGYHELAPSEPAARLALRLNALLGALGMTMLFLLAYRRFGLRTAFATVLLIGVASDWWYQSRGFFSEVGAGAFMLAALYFADAEMPYWCSLVLGISLLFRPTNIIALPIWIFSLRTRKLKDWPSVVFLVLGLGVLAYYNWIRFGSAADFGYGSEGFRTSVLIGLAGVLLSPGRSLFFYSPILILAITGGRLLYVKEKNLALVAFSIAAGYVIIAAGWQVWWGGKVWGSRLLTPIIPLLGILIAAVIDRINDLPNRRLAITVALLAAIGFGIQLLTLTQDPVLVLDHQLKTGYATYAQSIMSIDKNALALQIKNLSEWNVCNLDAYSVRIMFGHCG